MPAFRSIRNRRARRRIQKNFDLPLTSMMDVLVIIVVFLLKSYSTSTNSFTTVPGLKLPISTSLDIPPDSLHVIVTPEGLTFENEKIMEFTQTLTDVGTNGATANYQFKTQDIDEAGARIIPLFDALTKAREHAETLRAKSSARDAEGKPLPFEGILAIQADKRINYETLKKIMYTAAAAGFKVFRFLALNQES